MERGRSALPWLLFHFPADASEATLTIVHTFPDGLSVGRPLRKRCDGNLLYGSSDVTIFRMTPDGVVSWATLVPSSAAR